MTIPNLSWLSDVNTFAVNRLPAHSDHLYYESMEEAVQAKPMTMRHELNGNWKFHYSVNPGMRPEFFYQLDYNCSSWGNISVPGHIQLQGFGQPQYVNKMYPWDGHHEILPPQIPLDDNPVGSYVKTFTLPEKMEYRPVYISFQGVESAFFVWLNGEFVGYSEDSFTPAEFELTSFLREGENKLAVEVYQRSTGSWLEDQDFWRFSGIFRDVYLYTVPDIHVYDAYIRPELDPSFSKGTLTADLKFSSAVPPKAKLAAKLLDSEGQLVAVAEGKINHKGGSLSLEVTKPNLWSAEKPSLYKLYIQIYNEFGDLVEVIPQKVGFRRFELVDKIMRINGERIIFKGVNRHEFHYRTGRTISKDDMLWDIRTLKQNNINAVRTSHYPNQSYWYELCDEYGIYVIDEMNLETHGSWQKMMTVDPSWVIPGNKPEWQNIVMDRANSMLERDKNHPSILIWSCGNESYAGEVILNVSNYFRKVDSSRLVHYEGVFYDRTYNDTSDMESRMYATPAEIEKYLTEEPEKPYISCEYMHAMGNSLGGMFKYTEFESKYPLYQGGFIWDYIDQALVKKDRYGNEFLAYGGDFHDRPNDNGFCTNGIVYADRKLSPKMQEVKFLYQNIKLTPDQDGVTIKNENLFSNTGDYDFEVILYREGEELYQHKMTVVIAPKSEGRVEFDFPQELTASSGEYCIHTKLKLKQDTIWAEAGHEVAFGQYIFQVGSRQHEGVNGKFRVVHGDINIGIHGEDFSIMFSKQAGSLISLNYAGKEMIATPPAPLFWRATTDNDRGFSQDFHSGVWYSASLARKCAGFEVEESERFVRVTFAYQVAISNQVKVKVEYKVYPNGSVKVKSVYHGAEGLPQLPIFALSFKVPADYDQLEWYAMGPEENYSDRNKGARLGIFRNHVSENVSGYLMPQESGNRTGVRRVDVTNQVGQGLRISSVTEPLECTISPYTAFELEQAQHHFELPNIHYTVITVAGKHMGVGGDDSWGSPVHEEFRIQANQNLEFEFTIQRI